MCKSKSSTILVGTDRNHLRTLENRENLTTTQVAERLNVHVAKFGSEPVRNLICNSNWIRFNQRVVKGKFSLGKKSSYGCPTTSFAWYAGDATRAIILGKDGYHFYYKTQGYWVERKDRVTPYAEHVAQGSGRARLVNPTKTDSCLDAVVFGISAGAFPILIDVDENGAIVVEGSNGILAA